MKRRLSRIVVVLAFSGWLLTSSGCLYRHHNAACKQRAAALSATIETLKQQAHDALKIGTKKEAVTRFFTEQGLPVAFDHGYASGAVGIVGCAPSGCGSDNGLLGVTVKVDQDGTVIADPVVSAMYTNCL